MTNRLNNPVNLTINLGQSVLLLLGTRSKVNLSMDVLFREKSGKVLVVEGSGATRTLITETIRKLGFTDITGVPSAKDAFEQLEVDQFGWIVSSTFKDQPTNAFHLLRLATEVGHLRDTRVTLMIDEDEKDLLPLGFKLGLLSWHLKPFTKDTLNEQFVELTSRYESAGYKAALVAGHYLRLFLEEKGENEELIKLEKSLLKQYPSEYKLMINLVPPYSRLEKQSDAKSVLKQLQVLDEGMADKVKEYAEKYTGGSLEAGQGEDQVINILSLRKVLVVDPGSTAQELYTKVFQELGMTEGVTCVADGQAALDFVAANTDDLDLLIMEWRLAQVTGPLLLQRLRHDEKFNTPIIVASDLLEKDDYPLVREMGVASVMGSPSEKNQVLAMIVSTIQQDRDPTEKAPMELKIRDLIRTKKFSEALAIKNKYLQDTGIPQGSKETINAEFAYAQQDYEAARNHGIEAIKLSGDSLFTLNLLGKALIQLRDFETALRCFNKAQTLSPKNIERLCMIAEAQAESGEVEAADKTLEVAADIDPDSARVNESQAKVAINSGDAAKAKALMAQLDAIENVVSYMNNSAVTMARCGMVEKSLDQYRKTLRAIPDDKMHTKAIVMYNLALAHIRAEELEEAQMHLERCTKLNTRVKDKASKLLKSVKKALEKGAKLTMSNKGPGDANQGQNAESSADAGTKDGEVSVKKPVDLLATVSTSPGDIGLFLIYRPESIAPEAQKLVENLPTYRKRETIERDESAGADKSLANSA